jgi:subtilisin-like proprotein convertase family protein
MNYELLNLDDFSKVVILIMKSPFNFLKIKLFFSIFSFLWMTSAPFCLLAISPQPPSQIITQTTKHTLNEIVDIPSDTNSIAEVLFNIQGLEGVIWDVDVETFIQYISPNVLTITLEGPLGDQAVLMSEAGDKMKQLPYQASTLTTNHNETPLNANPFIFPFGNYEYNTNFYNQVLNGTIWDDQSSLPVTEVTYSITNQSHQASLAPEGALAVFNGKNPNGTWKLKIRSGIPTAAASGTHTWTWDEILPNSPIEIGPCPDYDYETLEDYKDILCTDKANEYSWGTLEKCEPNLFMSQNDFCNGKQVKKDKYVTADFKLRSKTYVKGFEDYGDAQNMTNCSLFITTAKGAHPVQWTNIVNNFNQNIDNNNKNTFVSSTLTVTNQGQNLKELEVYTDIDHNYPSTLKVSLVSPSGTKAILTANNGTTLNNIFSDTFWDDQAVTPTTDAIYQNGIAKRSLIPEGALALFRSENPNGNWKLEIEAVDGNNASGKLDQWGLRLTSYVTPKAPLTIPPPPSAFNGMTLKTIAYTNHQSHNIQNFSTLVVPFQVTGLEGSIWDVDLTAFIQHPSTKDLLISLISPDGKKAALSSENGFQRGTFPENYFPQNFVLDYNEADPPNNIPPFPFDNFVLPSYNNLLNGISWNDQATLPITDADYSADLSLGSVTAEGALDIFRGIDPNGEWKLEIQDTRPNQSASGTSKWFNQSIPHMTSFTTEGLATNCSLHLTVAKGDFEIKDNGFTNVFNESLTDMPLANEISVSGVGSKLEQVKVYTKISHPQSGKLDLTLTSPSGKKVVLSTDNGGNAANVFQGTLWNDRAPTDLRVTDVSFNNNQVEPLLVPEGALALFRGENPNGTWTLTVSDSQAAGTLEEWGLLITSYSVLLPPIVDYPPPPPPLPPPPYSLGNAYLFGQKSKTAYLLKQHNGALKEKPRAISELKAKHKIAAANYFSVPGSTNPMLCLILQYKNELTAKEVGTDGDFLNDAPLVISPLTERKDKVVASGDLNQDGYNDLVVQGKRRSVKILYGPDFPASSLPLTNNFRKLGKVVGVAGNRILSRKRNLLYATALPTDTNAFVSPPEILANGLKASLKIRGVADISETPGLELIVQEGKRIGYGPLNLNSPFGYIYTNRSDLNMGKAVGPR